jgi:hypothetical protein
MLNDLGLVKKLDAMAEIQLQDKMISSIWAVCLLSLH